MTFKSAGNYARDVLTAMVTVRDVKAAAVRGIDLV